MSVTQTQTRHRIPKQRLEVPYLERSPARSEDSPQQDELTHLPVSHHFGVSYDALRVLLKTYTYTRSYFVDHYFDTKDFLLAKQNHWLRVRYVRQGGKEAEREVTLVRVRRVNDGGSLVIEEETCDEKIRDELIKSPTRLSAPLAMALTFHHYSCLLSLSSCVCPCCWHKNDLYDPDWC